MNINIAGDAYKNNPVNEEQIPFDRIPVRVSDFALNEMLELPFKIIAIHLQAESKKDSIEDYLKFIEVFGRIFQVVKFEKLADDIYKVQIILDSTERPLARLKATYNAAKKGFELLYPYRYPMPKPAAHRPQSKTHSIIPLVRDGEEGYFFALGIAQPDDLKDGDEAEILVNSDPSAIQYNRPY
jgi:hypothetical protein